MVFDWLCYCLCRQGSVAAASKVISEVQLMSSYKQMSQQLCWPWVVHAAVPDSKTIQVADTSVTDKKGDGMLDKV